MNNQIIPGNVTDLDYQMNIIEQILYQQRERITNSNKPTLFEATEVIYEAIEQCIYELVEQTKYKCRYVILIGGILINSDSDMGAFISLKKTTLRNLSTGKDENILDDFRETINK